MKQREQFLPGTTNVYMKLIDTVCLAEMCGRVVGVRTGLLDVFAAFTNANVQAIYPSNDNAIWETSPGLKKDMDVLKTNAKNIWNSAE